MNKYDVAYQNEGMLLGSILQDSTILDEITVQPKHFFHDNNRNLFKEIKELQEKGEPISFITITALPGSKIKSMGGMDHIAAVMNSVPSVHAFKSYEAKIKEHYAIERARNLANNFLQGTSEINNIEALNDFLSKTTELEINTVVKQETFKEKLRKRVHQHYESPKEGLSGIDTGFQSVNRWTDGWQNSELIILGGRPSMGKTAFVLNSLLSSCLNDPDVFATFFSIEMSDETVIDRLIATTAGLSVNKMRNPNKTFKADEWDVYSKAVGLLESLNIDLRTEKTVSEIRAAVRKNMKDYPDKKHVVAIDYLTLMKSEKSSNSRTAEIEDIIVGLKDIARQFNIPVIVLSQLSRGVEARDNKRPNMGDLRDSGAIEQAADVIIMLYRDEYYNKDTDEPGIVELIFAKNRQGLTGTLKMHFIKESNKFGDSS